jgi:hypothetical protein
MEPKTPATFSGRFYFMTGRKITYSLNRIKMAKQDGYALEALIKSYHLNIDLIRYLLKAAIPSYSFKDKKIKSIVNDFLTVVRENPQLKSIINKKSLKAVKTWLAKTDTFFKTMKTELPKNTSSLQQETEKIFGILNISANKVFAKVKA